jgi:cytochrome b involved in lipid metabolism
LIKEKGLSEPAAIDIKSRLLWTVIDDVVYDITNYIDMHPGGKKQIRKGVGKDSTKMFHESHQGLKIENTPLALLKMGKIGGEEIKQDTS